jgi:hypothetical protein
MLCLIYTVHMFSGQAATECALWKTSVRTTRATKSLQRKMVCPALKREVLLLQFYMVGRTKSQVRRRNRIMCLMSQVRLLTRAPTTKTAATTMSARVVRIGKGLLVFVTSYPWYLCLCVFCRLIVFAVSQAEGVKCWAGRGGRDKYRRKAQAGVIYQKRG